MRSCYFFSTKLWKRSNPVQCKFMHIISDDSVRTKTSEAISPSKATLWAWQKLLLLVVWRTVRVKVDNSTGQTHVSQLLIQPKRRLAPRQKFEYGVLPCVRLRIRTFFSSRILCVTKRSILSKFFHTSSTQLQFPAHLANLSRRKVYKLTTSVFVVEAS
jgi:hypothetical protein